MNPRVTLGLLALFLALGGYLYFSPPAGGADADAASKLGAKPAPGKGSVADAQTEVFQFDERESQRLVVQTGERRTVVEKDPEGNWRLRPGDEPADRTRVQGTLVRLAGLRATRRLGETANLGDYGLMTPPLSVTVLQAAGTEFTLLLGSKAPADAGTYAKRTDDPAVFVVSNALVQDLERLVSEPPVQPTPVPTVASPTLMPNPAATPIP